MQSLHANVQAENTVLELGARDRQTDGRLMERKGKEMKSIYMAPFRTKVHTKHSGIDHTVLHANNTMPALPS